VRSGAIHDHLLGGTESRVASGRPQSCGAGHAVTSPTTSQKIIVVCRVFGPNKRPETHLLRRCQQSLTTLAVINRIPRGLGSILTSARLPSPRLDCHATQSLFPRRGTSVALALLNDGSFSGGTLGMGADPPVATG